MNYGAICANGKQFLKLHPYQEKAVRFLSHSQQGIFQADCGGGKTLLGIALISELKQPTIIFVHTTDLAKQWQREICEKGRGGAQVGIVGLGHDNAREITIATVQTVVRMPPKPRLELLSQFGMAVMDECLPSNSYILVMGMRGYPVWKQIYKIYNDERYDLALSFNFATQKNEWKRILRKFKNPHESNEWRLTSFGSKTCEDKIVTTRNHKIFEMDRGFIEAQELREGDHVASLEEPFYKTVHYFYNFGSTYLKNSFRYNLEIEDNHNFYARRSKDIGGVLVSNCHHVPAPTFAESFGYSPSKYRFGLTATPERSDQLEFLMYDIIGNKSFKVSESDLVEAGIRSEPPLITPIQSGYSDYRQLPVNMRAAMLTKLSEDDNRNVRIVKQIVEDWKSGYFPLIISLRVEHCIRIASWLTDSGMKVGLLIGNVDHKTRSEVISQAKAKLLDAIVGTKVADEGLDIPQLDNFHLVMPHSNKSKLKQQIGRIRRSLDGKARPIVRDYVDGGSIFQRMWNNRSSYYREWGFEIK